MSDDNNDNRTELFLDSFYHASILDLLGGELTYNELVRFSHDIEETAKFEITKIDFEDYSLVQVRINGNLLLDREYQHDINNEFIYLLQELLDEQEEEKKEEEEEEEDEDEIRVM
jgi:hypothetical protein